MRILIDSLIGLMLVAVAAGVVMLNHDRNQDASDVAHVKDALDRLHEQAAYHTAVQSAMVGHDTLLVHVHESWFGQDVPTNALLEDQHPWIDLAPPGDFGVHPPDPVATQEAQATFWYNPTTGVFRARVCPQSSEAQTLALYNEINGSSLNTFEQIPDPARSPIAHELGKTPAVQYASMANKTWSEPEPQPAEVNDQVFAPLIDSDAQETPQGSTSVELAEDGWQTHETVELVGPQFDEVGLADALEPEPVEPRPTLK